MPLTTTRDIAAAQYKYNGIVYRDGKIRAKMHQLVLLQPGT